MDAVAGLLDGPRAREAFLLRSRMAAPWSLEIRDEAPLTVVAVVRGDAWLVADGLTCHLGVGDIAVLRGPEPYLMADIADRPPQAVILPGQICAAPGGGPQDVMGPVGIRSWGNDADGGTELLTGTYPLARAVSQRLLASVPPALYVAADDWDCPYVALLADEIGKDQPGQDAVLDRLLDLLLVAVLRTWLARNDSPTWYRAYDDPMVGPVLRLMQHAPAEPWTLDSLAAQVSVSRATLSRRFAELVEETPMSFLARWRVSLAADLLRESDSTLDHIARRVGYGSAFALSTAFKRERGLSPRDYRQSEVT
jgi:AraC-like DNA-binding protein